MERTINDFLEELAFELEKESNAKVKKGMEIFIRSDNIGRRVFLHATGFYGDITAINLRKHFEYLDLVDSIDLVLSDMEDNLPC